MFNVSYRGIPAITGFRAGTYGINDIFGPVTIITCTVFTSTVCTASFCCIIYAVVRGYQTERSYTAKWKPSYHTTDMTCPQLSTHCHTNHDNGINETTYLCCRFDRKAEKCWCKHLDLLFLLLTHSLAKNKQQWRILPIRLGNFSWEYPSRNIELLAIVKHLYNIQRQCESCVWLSLFCQKESI